MQVVAMQVGFYGGSRRRVGDVFDIPDESMKKREGKPILPKWVAPAPNAHEAKIVAAKAKQADQARRTAGAVAASGGAAAKAKADKLAAQLAG